MCSTSVAVAYWTPKYFIKIKNLEISLYGGRKQAAVINETNTVLYHASTSLLIQIGKNSNVFYII